MGMAAMGINAVAGMGTASVIHQMIMRLAMATTRHPSVERPSGAGKSSRARKTTSPMPIGIGRMGKRSTLVSVWVIKNLVS